MANEFDMEPVMKKSITLTLITLCILTSVIRADDDRKQLLEGVKSLHSGGSPGAMVAFGDAIILLTDAGSARNPVAVAGKLGKGRIVAVSHSGFLEPESFKNGDNQKFVSNSIAWTSQGGKPKVVTVGMTNTAKALKSLGFDAVEGAVPKFAPGTVIIASPGSLKDGKAVQDFIEAGGGVILGMPGWGWQQLNPGKSLAKDLPVAPALAAAGIAFGDGFAEKDKKSGGYPVFAGNLDSSHSGKAVEVVERWLKQGTALDPADVDAVRAAINRINDCVPNHYAKPLRERLSKALADSSVKIPVPMDKQPLGPKDPNGRLLLGITNQLMIDMPVDLVKAHPAAAAFPGAVSKEAPRVNQEMTIDIDPTGYICDGVGVSSRADIWHSTGLYAAPGEKVTITLPDEAVKSGFSVQIGCHTDRLWHLKSWMRAPQITRVEKVTGPTTVIANPFGGLVYILSPYKVKLGKIKTRIEGAVPAPRYVHGQTTPLQWSEQRKLPGPWTELESDKIIIAIPTQLARKIEDPKAIMEFWDKVQDHNADLTAVDRKRGRAERIVHDVQISAGYMHSGYPIMCPTSAAASMMDVNEIQRKGNWGYFHELGHNHQQREWTFDGTVEVTCNLYSLYICNKLCSNAPLHDSIQPAAIRRNATKYKAGGTKFDTWKSDPFTALIIYKQWQEAFGWEAFLKLHAEYQKLPTKERPKNDQEERDQLMVRMSKIVGKNLAPHFDYWGIPVTEPAKKSIADMPVWMFPDPTK